MRKISAERKEISLLKDVEIWNKFQEKVIHLLDLECQICSDISGMDFKGM